jgi:hypothetical protein
VTIRIADARLLAPSPVRRVLLLDAPAGWDDALSAAGVEVVVDAPDLVIASNALASDAASVGAPAAIVLGRSSAPLRRRGYATRSFVLRPGANGPRLFVPLDAPAAVAQSLLAERPGRSAVKRLATRAALAAARIGLPGVPVITVAQLATHPPATLAAAETMAGAAVGDDWFLWLGEGDDLQRAVWLCFGRDAKPSWAVKCSRVPGNVDPFSREEAAGQILAALPAELRQHAPRHAGRFDADGLPGSIESAAPGVPLQDELEAGFARQATVEAVADWIVAVGLATAQPADALAGERLRLEGEVSAELALALPSLPAVFQHNDLGTWNVVVDQRSFTVLDWESSSPAGLPLWDLVYFLTDALAARRGQTDPAEKLTSMLALLRGDSAGSQLLFERVAAAADAFGVPTGAVGPIVTLGWLHHGRSRAARAERGQAQNAATGSLSTAGPLERLAEPWLADPALGVEWPAFGATGR